MTTPPVTQIGKRGRRKLYTNDQLLKFLQWAAEYHEKDSLSWIEYEQWIEISALSPLPVPQTIAARFGTWQKAVQEAGLRIAISERSNKKFELEDINNSLRNATDYHKSETLTIAQYEKWRASIEIPTPSARWIIIRSNTWLDALYEAGIGVSDKQLDALYTDNQMLKHLQVAAAALNTRTLSISEYEKYRNEFGTTSIPGSRTIASRFGTWREAQLAAGLVPIVPGFTHINNKNGHAK